MLSIVQPIELRFSRMEMKRLFLGLTAVGAACALTACSTDSGVGPGASADGNADGSGESLSIFATTGYLADAAKNIAPEADVFTMVGPGGDPHTYQPSTKDIEKMQIGRASCRERV